MTKVLILQSPEAIPGTLEQMSVLHTDITIIQGSEARGIPKDPARVDLIVAMGDCSPGSALINAMLSWRLHLHTYLIPCWLPIEKESVDITCLWPRLAIDRFSPNLQVESFSGWLSEISQWQQTRMHFKNRGSIVERSALELVTSLSLRRASGTLDIFDDEGGEGRFHFKNGNLVAAALKHFRGSEAFHEFLCMSRGGYTWDGNPVPIEGDGEEIQPLHQLIAEGLKLIEEGNLLYSFIPDPEYHLTKTESQSALDDAATKFFPQYREIYGLIDGHISVPQIIKASPLSTPRTMVILAKWLSLEDIAPIKREQQQSEPKCRVLVVDDSPLMCRALQSIIVEDPRLELAGVAHDGIEALRLIETDKPDVVTLDLHMPKMDGITTLKHIMIRDPKPVVVLSAFAKESSTLTYESFKYGAVDVLLKPANGSSPSSKIQSRELCDRIFQASRVQLAAIQHIRRKSKGHQVNQAPYSPSLSTEDAEHVMIVLCGTGGFPSLIKLFFAISHPERLPFTIIGMDLPGQVVEALVSNLQQDTPVLLKKVTTSEPLDRAVCYFLSNDHQYKLRKNGKLIWFELESPRPEKIHFFDELLTSAADSFQARTTAAFLSGSGEEGLAGMRRVKQFGGTGFALSPNASLRPELPKNLIEQGYAREMRTITDLAGLLDAERFLRMSS